MAALSQRLLGLALCVMSVLPLGFPFLAVMPAASAGAEGTVSPQCIAQSCSTASFHLLSLEQAVREQALWFAGLMAFPREVLSSPLPASSHLLPCNHPCCPPSPTRPRCLPASSPRAFVDARPARAWAGFCAHLQSSLLQTLAVVQRLLVLLLFLLSILSHFSSARLTGAFPPSSPRQAWMCCERWKLAGSWVQRLHLLLLTVGQGTSSRSYEHSHLQQDEVLMHVALCKRNSQAHDHRNKT